MGLNAPGEQTKDARLWEDPFKTPLLRSKGKEAPEAEADLPVNNLAKQISTRRVQCTHSWNGWILPVMIPGGPYSEDQESRIRSRFAVVSALGEQGYLPEDPEHIGSILLQWPTTQEITHLNKEANEVTPFKELYKMFINNTATHLDLRYDLDLRYEWYRPKDFHPRGSDFPGEDPQCPYVLVLWLNERDFASEPLLLLPLLLEITGTIPKTPDAPHVTLIGPGLSSTLYNMLPSWDTKEVPLQKDSPRLWWEIQDRLRYIDVYSTTATAMDAALVKDSRDDANPRDSVGKALQSTIGFNSFKNFVATDDQLAEEMLNELFLRGVDFTKMKGDSLVNHLVLLSEWDTFYARVLGLTYAAKLAIQLKLAALQKYPGSTDDFIKQYRTKVSSEESPLPPNLHLFFYLRGLDGQTVENNSGSARDSNSNDTKRAIPTSVEELRKLLPDANKWTPDANKAEGQAQFDYLSRLGEQLATLEEKFSAKDEHIKAIGVVGSDVYDTLLILQALRHRFPNVLFFTTGLDARFWHPRELSWSRNLIVTSGYGLMLNSALQPHGPMPPFRDSTQTAQFAAVLAALRHKDLGTLTSIPPRRFEIGRRGPVDLSVQPSIGVMTSAPTLRLHPDPKKSWGLQTYIGIGMVCLTIMLLLIFFCGPLRRLIWEASRFQAEPLRYREEDIGGIVGASTLYACLQKSAQEQQDPLAQCLAQEYESAKLGGPRQQPSAESILQEETCMSGSPVHEYIVLPSAIEKVQQALDKEKATVGVLQEIDKEGVFHGWLNLLNRLLHRRACPPGEAIEQTSLLPREFKVKAQGWWSTPPVRDRERSESPQQLRQGWDILEALIQRLVEEPQKSGEPEVQDTLDKAQAAREASLALYGLRRRWVCHFRILATVIVMVAAVLGYCIWQDTFSNVSGEPFSLTTGTSAWPGEILRFAALALAIGFIFQLYHSLQTMTYQLTRHFRLPLVSDKPKSLPAPKRGSAIMLPWFPRTFRLPAPTEPGATVSASTLWEDYQRYGIFWRRLCRLLYPLIPYIVFGIGLMLWSGIDMLRPLRGTEAWAWDPWLLYGASLSFLFLTFMTIDAACLCRWFIQCLSEVPTEYSLATTNYFSRLRGDVDRRYLDEWIDLQLIADLTEHVDRLVYCPFIVFFLLLLARNEWWDRWPWPWPLITIFVVNLMLAAASVIILQNAARKAKSEAEATLATKVKRLQAATAESEVKNNANQAERLLEEIRSLRRGAFVPFWENPVLGAVLLPSGGMAVVQMLIWFMGP
jgi:hypothetical protein